MKKVVVVYKKKRHRDFLNYLKDSKIKGATFNSVEGFGIQFGHKELHSGAIKNIILHPKIKMEAIILTEDLDEFVSGIQEFLQTGRMADGKIWVEDIENVIRIRTGESGDEGIK